MSRGHTKDVRALVRKIRRAGWQVELSSGHYTVRPPTGNGRVVIASSPSCSRWRKNTEAELRRAGFQGK